MSAQHNQQASGATRVQHEPPLKVKIGDMLQIHFLDKPERGRFHVRVIGLQGGRNLIISAPMSDGNLLMLREGQQFVVRSLAGKQVLGFVSEVVKCYMNPYPYVHLRTPGQIEQYDVRNAYRVDVELIAALNPLADDDDGAVPQSGRSLPGVVLNISTTGCLLRARQALDENINRLSLSLRVDVAEHQRTMQIAARICSRRECQSPDDDAIDYLYGLEFEDMEDDRRLMLYCFVYEQIAHEIYS